MERVPLLGRDGLAAFAAGGVAAAFVDVDGDSGPGIDHSITLNRQFFALRSRTKSWIPTSRTTDTMIARTITMHSRDQ